MTFVAGHILSRALYDDIVEPMIALHFPELAWAATLFGEGSDVLGYDTERSMDHDWGPRLNLLLREEDVDIFKPLILAKLDDCLPPTILGVPTDLNGSSQLPGEPTVLHHTAGDGRTHGIRIDTPQRLLRDAFGIESIDEFDIGHWLTTSPQTLLEWTSGPVLRDDIGEWTRIRNVLKWYPDDIWRYQMAARWKRIAQLEAFVGRCGELDDDLGSQIIAITIIEDAMKLAFLQERRYIPYAKWLGTACGHLDAGAQLRPHLEQIRFARTWQDRETGLLAIVSFLGERHNALQVTETVECTIQLFHNRPFRVIFAERFSRALQESIQDKSVLALPVDLGGSDHFIDSTDAQKNRSLQQSLANWFRSHSSLTENDTE